MHVQCQITTVMAASILNSMWAGEQKHVAGDMQKTYNGVLNVYTPTSAGTESGLLSRHPRIVE